jgi:hypothetical protein
MNRKSFGPGLAVLTLTTVLALAGARPAAAQDLGLFTRGMQWLASLWSAPAQAHPAQARTMASQTENATVDKGLGVDPNGGSIVAEPPPLDAH